MKYTKKLLNHKNMTVKQANKLADELYRKYALITFMIPIQNIDWENDTNEEVDTKLHQHQTYLEYTTLKAALLKYSSAERRSSKMQQELNEAINNAEQLGLNIY